MDRVTSLVSRLFARDCEWSWRSFFAFVLAVGAATALLYTGKLDGAQWTGLVEWSATVFTGSELGKKAVSTFGAREVASETP